MGLSCYTGVPAGKELGQKKSNLGLGSSTEVMWGLLGLRYP